MSRLQVVAPPAQPLSPAQRKFNRLLARVNSMEALVRQVQERADALRAPHSARMDALRRRVENARRAMAHALHERLQRPGLAAPQQRSARELLRALVPATPAPQDKAGQARWQALRAAYAPPPAPALREEDAQDLLRQFEETTGERLEMPALEQFGTPGQLLDALMRQLRERQQAAAERRAERRSARKPTARQRLAQAQEQDARGALRGIYRQLASALHPDRERDPAERERKQALMSQANTAHERGDLLALLRLQLAAEQVDEAAIARLGEQRLAALTLLLQRQVGVLDRELAEAEARLSHELGVDVDARQAAHVLPAQLQQAQQHLQAVAEAMERDLELVREDAGLRRWLRAQSRMAQEQEQARAQAMRMGWGAFG